MLNIRENIAKMAVVTIFTLVGGTFPHANAYDVVEAPKVPAVVKVVDPLQEFKDAKALNESELKELLQAVGFEGKALRTAWAVAMKESNGRPLAHNKNANTGDNSYGIYQINMIGDLGPARREKFDLKTNADLFDPVTNAKIAYFMTAGGKNWSSWKIYPGQNNGERYEAFLDRYALN
jgi:hypothetical protein